MSPGTITEKEKKKEEDTFFASKQGKMQLASEKPLSTCCIELSVHVLKQIE